MASAMKFANSVSVPLPRMIAPACRSFLVMKASSGGMEPASATEPAVVGMSAVSMLSFSRMGMPKSGRELSPSGCLPSALACASAFGFTNRNAFTCGPALS